MADAVEAEGGAFRKFDYRGVDLDQLLDMKHDLLMELMHSRPKGALVGSAPQAAGSDEEAAQSQEERRAAGEIGHH